MPASFSGAAGPPRLAAVDKSIVPRRFLVRSQSEPGPCRRCFPASALFFDIGPGVPPGGEKIRLIHSARSCSFCSNRWRIHSRPSAKTSSSISASVGSRSGSFCIILLLKHRSCLRGGGKGGIAPRADYSSSVKMRTHVKYAAFDIDLTHANCYGISRF